jgi:NAD(P)-dependent dehydrogenase (short-subunit alcohol dehydrogenase family)
MLTVIAGVGPGLGMSLARRFGAAPGDRVALLVRDDASGSRFVDELAGLGIEASAHAADLGDEASLRAALGAVRAAQGDPDVVVYNASLGIDVGPADVSADQVIAALRLGTLAALATYQETVPAMLARGSGTFVVTGSGVSLHPWPGTIALTLDKAALRAFALAAAREVKGSGVHVGTVTIDGLLNKPGFEPDHVAETFWAFHSQVPDAFEAEVRHSG